MSRTISTILSLKDNMSGGVMKVSEKVKGLSKEAQLASIQVARMANNVKKKAEEMADKALKIGTTMAAVAGGLALKTGLSKAMDLEGYRVQIETATKSTQKAGEIMKWANKFANITPFDTGEVVESSAKLESMGISAQKTLPAIADMAGATNKSIDQATEAFIDAQTGELERLKEFGIKKADIQKKAQEMFKNQEVINAKGQIVDQEKFNEALMALMEQRFKGGAEKLAGTTKGLWSTIKGTATSALAEMVGMTTDGTIKENSILDKLKKKAQEVAEQFNKWQEDGTISQMSEKISEAFGKIYEVVSNVVSFMIEHNDAITNFAIVIGSLMIAVKVTNAIRLAIIGLQIAWGILNGTIAITPLGWILIIIALVIAAVVLLWKNWDYVKLKAFELWNCLSQVWTNIKNYCIGVWNSISSYLTGLWNSIVSNLQAVWNGISSFLTGLWNGIVSIAKTIWNGLVAVFMAVINIIKIILYPFAKMFEIIFKLMLATTIIVAYKIYNAVMWAFTQVYTFVSNIITAVVNYVANKWNWLVSILAPIISGIINIVVSIFTAIYDFLSGILTTIWTFIVEVWNSIYSSVSEVMSSIWNFIVEIWDSVYNSVSEVVTNIWNFIVDGFTKAKDGIVDVFTGIKDIVMGVFDGVWDGIKSILNTGIDMVNGFIGGVNKVIKGANEAPGVNIPTIGEIPKFALGTSYFSSGGMALVGENGPELINMPKGSSVTTANDTRKALSGQSVNVYVTVQGNVIGNEEYMDEMGQFLTNRILLAMQR